MTSRRQSFRCFARTPYFCAPVAVACVLAWDATAGARHLLPAARPETTKARELSCDTNTHTRLQLLGALPEASGLALSRRTPAVLWSIDDTGDPSVMPLSTAGQPMGRVRITGATVRDWEAVTVGPCPGGSCLYVGDIGDDQTKRTELTVYRVPEPKPDEAATARADAFLLDYPSGHHDAEALFVAPDGTLFIITKGHPAILLRAPRNLRPGAPAMLERVAELPLEDFLKDRDRKQTRVTDASTSPDGNWVALRTNAELLLYRTRDLVAGRSADVWHADLRPLDETQGEGVAISNDGDVYLAGEGGGHGLPGTFAHIKCGLPK